jgi:hypothetical protein
MNYKITDFSELGETVRMASADELLKISSIYGEHNINLVKFQNAIKENFLLPRIKGYPPAIFISYKWSDEKHSNWIRKLVKYLEAANFHVYVDYKADKLVKDTFENVPEFLGKIAKSQYFLIIATKDYLDFILAQDGKTSWVFDENQQALTLSNENMLKIIGITFPNEGGWCFFNEYNSIILPRYTEDFSGLKKILPVGEVLKYFNTHTNPNCHCDPLISGGQPRSQCIYAVY